MTSAPSLRTSLNYGLLLALSSMLALMLHFQTMDPGFLATATSTGYGHIVDSIGSWLDTVGVRLYSELSLLFTNPAQFVEQVKKGVE